MFGAKFHKTYIHGMSLKDVEVAGSTLDEALSVDSSWREANFWLGNEKDISLYERMETKFGKEESEMTQAVVEVGELNNKSSPKYQENTAKNEIYQTIRGEIGIDNY